MTNFLRRMMSGEEEDSRAKSMERRRRRIDIRRFSSLPRRLSSLPAVDTSHVESSSYAANNCTSETVDFRGLTSSVSCPVMTALEQPTGPPVDEPKFGTMSFAGKSREMEDAIAVYTSLCRPAINRRRPVHFFAVFDGHGGSHVATLCRERMHLFLEEELMRVDHGADSSESGDGSGDSSPELIPEKEQGEEGWEEKWRRVLKRSFLKMDKAALTKCACGGVLFECDCHPMEVALGGSTAVVTVLTPEHVVVANCGDSRAVLRRSGRAIPLSFDHKPDRLDELARIEAAGGRVICRNGARVEGILAMSRAIGDHYLKPAVIAEPEITFTKREPEDECLIIASDGLWDVLSSDLACEVASECLQESNPPTVSNVRIEDEEAEALYPSRSVLAAALLTRLALGRRSCDNISVIVVDLKRS